MKLATTLPERPGLLHALPVLDLFALLILIFVLGPSLQLRPGISVEVPPSRFQLDRYVDTIVVTLSPGDPVPHIHLGRDEVTKSGLSSRLDELKERGANDQAIVLLRSNPGIEAGGEREVMELVLAKGFKLALAGESSVPPAPLKPPAPATGAAAPDNPVEP